MIYAIITVWVALVLAIVGIEAEYRARRDSQRRIQRRLYQSIRY